MSHTLRPAVEQLERRDTPATLYALTADSRLLQFDSADPSRITSDVPLDNPGDRNNVRPVGIAFRPRTGQLFSLHLHRSTYPTGQSAINYANAYVINPLTGKQTRYLDDFELPGLSGVPSADATAAYGVSFDPVTDELRITNSNGYNGRFVMRNLTFVRDSNVSPVGQAGSSTAFDRNFDGHLGAAGTTMYAVNAGTGNLQTQGGLNGSPGPNGGGQSVVGPLGTPIDPTGGVGLAVAARPTTAGPAFAVFDGDTTSGVSTGLYSVNLTNGAATRVGLVGDGTTKLIGLTVAPEGRFAAGSGAGTDSKVEVYDPFSGNLLRTINPFPGFFGGVTVAVADVNRDTVPDVIVGANAGGGPHVKVYDGVSGAELYSFFAFSAAFRGGVSVAGADVNADGYDDLVIGAGPGGGPHVKAFSGKDLSEQASFMAFDVAFRGGVSVAAGDFDWDGAAEMVVGAGPGGGPHVQVFARNPLSGSVGVYSGYYISGSFFAYDVSFRGGVTVAVGDVDGDGVFDVITGAGAGGGPHVKAFGLSRATEISSFFPFDTTFSGGVRVGVADVNRDGQMEILASGPGTTLRAFSGPTRTLLKSFDVLAGASGVTVAG